MESVRQKFRPKHQVLILKCYPRYQKNTVEVKPNSSELSYLLYYASTRRSKLQKVGDYLEKKTLNDVYKGRSSDVQVTLQIVRALIEKTPRDLPLYIASVLSIFRSVLQSKDLVLIEESIPTFETFCSHQDAAILSADTEWMNQHLDILRMYAELASKDAPVRSRTTKSIPAQIKERKAGLNAVSALTTSELLNAETEKQFAIAVAPLLENIFTTDARNLVKLGTTEEELAEAEKLTALRRRQSTNTVRPKEEDLEMDPIAASSTVEDADQIAEQEVAVIALLALKQIFSTVTRLQMRFATIQVLNFIGAKIRMGDRDSKLEKLGIRQTDSWAATLFRMLCSWAPVQDRYVILVTISENLATSQLVDDDFDRQRCLAVITARLLSSDINFIGLSIMDIQLSLLQHMLHLISMKRTRTDSIALSTRSSTTDFKSSLLVGSTSEEGGLAANLGPLPASIALLEQLQVCIGNLAVHIYYSDQVIDMVHAILVRLKPSPQSIVPSTASAIENPIAAAESTEKTHGSYFASSSARMLALNSVKEIILKANTKRDRSSSTSAARAPLGLIQWEGTQWLLCDPGFEGRAAYVAALLTWVKHELKKVDLRVTDDFGQTKKDKKDSSASGTSLARRAVSNASQREKSPLRRRETFLQLLHLAIYENALAYADEECDILLLHLLLSSLTQKLGVNAVRHGLPMIMRLQEEIPSIDSALGKVNVGSLVHGYLWSISYHFDFDHSAVGRSIESEIQRRTQHNTWTSSIRIPALGLEQIMHKSQTAAQPSPSAQAVATESLRPFDDREAFVKKIAEGYSSALHSPPSSPPQSPIRSYSRPVLGQSSRTTSMSEKPRPVLSGKAREAMMEEWTREACIAATGKSDGSRSGSLSGSQTATSSSKHLAATYGLQANGLNGSGAVNSDGTHSPTKSQHVARSVRPTSAAFGFVHLAGSAQQARSRRPSQSPTPMTTSSVRSAVRVEDLKAVLSGSQLVWPVTSSIHSHHRTRADADVDDTASESMASYEGSEISLPIDTAQPNSAEDGADLEQVATQRSTVHEGSATPRPLTAVNTATTVRPGSIGGTNNGYDETSDLSSGDQSPKNRLSIPPVPPLPMNINIKSAAPTLVSIPKRSMAAPSSTYKASVSSRPHSRKSVRMEEPQLYSPARSLATSAGDMSDSYDYATIQPRKAPRGVVNVGKLLDDIDADAGFGLGVGRTGGLIGGKPPY